MTPATTATAARVLKLREAVDRATLHAARQAHADRAAAAAALAGQIAREHAFVAEPAMVTNPIAAAWRGAADARLTAAHAATTVADAACDAPQAALVETLRLRRGLDNLAEHQRREHDRTTARRDPLALLMFLAPRLEPLLG